ncbi:MAG: PQQ-dependent sugar dehydrogenase [Pseudonocardia sp.]|nr:PQQ-dependent sugar dehydrogenase [Pseudonocardia sp.]
MSEIRSSGGLVMRFACAVIAAMLVCAACSSSAPSPGSPPPVDESKPLVHALPDPTPAGIGITLTKFLTMPASMPNRPVPIGDNLERHDRINYLGEIPDGSGRLFVPDLNGKLYFIVNGVPREYLDVGAQVGPNFWDHEGIGTGFGFVAFHPDFARNGKFYTVDTEARDALRTQTPDLPYPKNTGIHGVVTEWTASNPAADTFAGTHREVLRIGLLTGIHGILQIGFNPTASPGTPDYGLLYLAVGDGGAAGDARESLKTTVPGDLSLPQGKILRIDPGGTNGAHGQYGIPPTNPFVGRPGALPEIYASGLRGPYRFSWDSGDDHRMFLGNIGNEQVESIYDVHAGDNYGWPEREGPFVVKLGEGPESCDIFPLPADDKKYNYTYPVIAYTHNEVPPGHPKCQDSGYAVIAGFVYRGQALPDLRGKYIFGDGVTGRIFYTDPADMRRGNDHLATIYELTLFDQQGKPIALEDVVGNPDVVLAGHRKVDLRFGMDARGELYVLSKANGEIWRVTASHRPAPPPARPQVH